MQLTLKHLFVTATLLRVGFFLFGLYQDNNFLVKYTDIDYLVFSDAARYVYDGLSPYKRETYRYTPLLAWMLVPNSWGGIFAHFGKFLFMLCDILTGILISRNLAHSKISHRKKLIFLSIWLLNPMVVTISTRGSSESILTFFIMLSVDLYLNERYVEAAFWLGLSIHFKIYPIIYLPGLMLNLATKSPPFPLFRNVPVLKWLNSINVKFLVHTLISLTAWNVVMYYIYGYEFIYHSYIYHFTRLDHRHNFSLYNVMLYYKSAYPDVVSLTEMNCWSWLGQVSGHIEKVAFLPQLFLSAIILPLLLAQKDIIACLFVQTFAFVLLNKVITSQYFIWFLIFLPQFLANSKLSSPLNLKRSSIMIVMWSFSQACWLFYAYKLEFLGESTFTMGLFCSSVFFYLTNCWVLGQFIEYI
ncbi:hypothetical protein METBIDRAFT_31181 [Metschnikowia bicuspidata var. bicuspidata NRRL YB-4993]|uniref:GPI mannosyltransferase 1 n=1 Tax=Metschnikowia bicuspidata var. bicuspidata NRRL YB-4993 TaxID=869754 RepID=A0A1A0HE40_9ASCO|nr:hypothetical protein METBIDRAFT_31181 [Metschnikowia bicuspidata var. bicuspidata NRRL YB-4993]OBA22250.1 hypothetical protein METBIDRAFT_31181 [Metschnikowia bicuspidata var. bicuspidata NRRL YB-4993]